VPYQIGHTPRGYEYRDSARAAGRPRRLVAVHQDSSDQPPAQGQPEKGQAEQGQPEGERAEKGRAEPRQLAALDLPMVPFAVGGLIVWLIVGAILAPFHTSLAAHGRGEWLRICVAGFLVGLPGLALMLVHDRNRRRRRPADNP
jgi:Protein of unknown function (DUF2530)